MSILFFTLSLLILFVNADDSNNCFLNYPVGEVFEYEFNTELTISKHDTNAENLGILTDNHDIDMRIICQITNHGADKNGIFHFELDIVDGFVSNPDQWQHFKGVDMDEEMLREKFVASMQLPFFYEQNCDLSIHNVYFAAEDEEAAINTKKQLVAAFSALMKSDTQSYDHFTRDHLGPKTVTFKHQGMDDGNVKLTLEHDAVRKLPVEHRALRRTHEDVAAKQIRHSFYKDGVLEKLEEHSGSRWPADDSAPKLNHMSPQANNGAHLIIKSSSKTRAQLTARRALPESRRRSAPLHFDTYSEFVAQHHPSMSFDRAALHTQHKRQAPLAEMTEDYRAVFVSASRALLHRFEHDNRDAHTGNLVNDPTSELLELWRVTAKNHGDEAVVELACVTLGFQSDCTLKNTDQFDIDSDEEVLPQRSLAAGFNLLASLDTVEAQRAVLQRAVDVQASWQMRNRALMALALFREPDVDVMARVRQLYKAPGGPRDDAHHVQRQALLTYGALIYNDEASADAAYARAAVDGDNDGMTSGTARQQAARERAEAARRQLHDEFVEAPQRGALSVDTYSMALHNSLKDIRLHDWMDPATILKQRGIPLRSMLSQEHDEPELHAAAQLMDEAPLSHVMLTGECRRHAECGTGEMKTEKATVSSDPRRAILDAAAQAAAKRMRAHEKNPGLAQRKRNVLQAEQAPDVEPAVDDNVRVVSKDDPAVQNLETKPPNFDQFETEAGRANVRVSERIANFFEEHKCKPWGACSAYSYRNKRPVGEPQEGNRQLWNNTLGSDKFYAYLEALMDFRGDPIVREELGSSYQFFAGGLVSANIYDAELPILQAYAAGSFQYRSRAGEDISGANCTTFELELYFDYLLNAYYLKASAEKNCTTGIESTCEANYPPEEEINYHQFAGVEFFRFEYQLNQGWLQALFVVRGEGSIGMNINWGMYISELKGGLALNGLIEPLGKVDIVASVSAPILKYQGAEVLGIEVGGRLNLIQLSFPALGGLNANTYRGCASLSVVTKALGGTITIKLRVLGQDATDFEVLRWKGAQFELPVLKTSCCKECAESCYNAFCNYRFGECECLLGYDGPGCDIECPPGCEWPAEPHPGVDCSPGGPRGASCRCNSGSYGWNCMSECPGGRQTPCNLNGDCDLEGLCTCDEDYYGADCSLTCPVVDGEVCGAHGRCVFDGEEATCQCFANAVGPKCELKCPESLDERKAPCSRRGDCWQDPLDGKARCLCRLGFHGDRCELLDINGSGRMLEIESPMPDGVVFPTNQTGAERFAALKNDGASYAGLWFQPTQMPTAVATLVQWRFGSLTLTKNGDVRFCSGKDADCYTSPQKAAVDEWHYFSAEVRHHSGQVVVRHWKKDALGTKHSLEVPLNTKPLPEVTTLGENVVVVAKQFQGKLDQLALMHAEVTPTLAQPTFTDQDALALRDEIIADHHASLVFYLLFDLGRGDHLYDQVSMLRGRLPDRCPTENRAPSTCRKERFQYSDINVQHATISSSLAPALKLNGQKQAGSYTVHLSGRRVIDSSMDVVINAQGSCSVTLYVGNVEAAKSQSITGQASVSLQLNPAGVSALADGDNSVAWQGTNGCVIAQSALTVRVDSVDAAVEFGGSPFSYARLDHSAMPLTGSWQLELWTRRDPVLASTDGVLLGLVPNDYQPKTELNMDIAEFLLYENGGTGQGLRMKYRTGGVHVFENWATPVNTWFHIAVQVRHSGSECTLSFFLDGVDLALGNPNAKHACGSDGALRGFGGSPVNELRLGMAFGGEINDLFVWNAPQSNVRGKMHLLKNVQSTKGAMLAAYTFDDVDDVQTTAVIDAIGKQANGELLNGAFRSLIYGVYHQWKLCPGITYFSTETVCSTRTYWEQGICERRPGVDNYQCNCREGFFGTTCSGECPGGAGNICSNHGKCVVMNVTTCACDRGYVGPACEFECPGWTAPLNLPNQKICFGYGTCQLRPDGKGAECLCDQEFDRYGPYCQYSYGEDPLESIEDGCSDCRGAHKVCVDGQCLCEKGYYLVVGVCKAGARMLAPSIGLLIALLLQALLF